MTIRHVSTLSLTDLSRIPLTVNVLGLIALNSTLWKLAVRGLGSAVTGGKVVDDETEDIVARDVLDAQRNSLNVLDIVATEQR